MPSVYSPSPTPQPMHNALLQAISIGAFIVLDGKVLLANTAMALMLGRTPQSFEGTDFAQMIAPEFLGQWTYRIALCSSSGAALPGNYRVRLLNEKTSEEIWVEMEAKRLEYPQQPAVLVTARDVTEQRRTEQYGRLRDHVLERLARGAGLESVLHSIVFATEEVVPGMSCGVFLVGSSRRRLVSGAAPNFPQDLVDAIERLYFRQKLCGDGTPGYFDALALETCIADVSGKSCASLALESGFGASWTQPILNAAGEVNALFVACYAQPGRPSHCDSELLQHAVKLAGLAIERKRSEEELQLASLVYQTSAEGMMVIDVRARVLAINPAFSGITGYGSAEMIGANARALRMLCDAPVAMQGLCDALEKSGHWQGEMWGQRKNGESFACWVTVNTSLDELGEVQRRIVLFSDITNRKQSDELIWRQANFDALTQLPNRNMLQAKLSLEVKRAVQEGHKLALLSIDLDKFKDVNDALGQERGDQVLCEAARRITQCVGTGHAVARMGSNEFMVLFSALDDVAAVDAVVTRLLVLMAQPYALESGPTVVGASMGLAFYPGDTCDPESLITHATQAMQLAKSKGGNQCCCLTSALQKAARARTQLIRDLRLAVSEKQLMLHFQPIVDMQTGKVKKAEALVRWCHPERGMVSPAEFIPLAEETGLIVEIGNWVFEEAARCAKRWCDHFDPGFQISINKSPAQFDRSGNGARAWLDYIQALGLPGSALVIEITEGILLQSASHVGSTMKAYRDAGIQLAIDDFGTGYSALSYLQKFDIDYLKIDQSFTRNLANNAGDLALCEAITVMANRLGLKVVAEGIETLGQRRLLTGIGCDYGQGYLFNRPMAAAEFEQLLQEQTHTVAARECCLA